MVTRSRQREARLAADRRAKAEERFVEGPAPSGHNSIAIRAQPGPQEALIRCPIEDVFFGGARGGGKTFGMLLDWMDHALTYGRYATGCFFRRVAKNLEEVIAEAHRIFPAFGGKWLKGSGTYVFKSGPAAGARLKFRHLMNEADAEAYQGHQYTWICFEEVTQWPTSGPADLLKGTLRSAHGVPTMFRATGNPGGAGHNWVKARYISPAPNGYKIIVDAETGERRTFIPSKLEDNQILMTNDPKYEQKLRRVGTPALIKAWRFGNWDIVAGGFFDDLWDPKKHILSPFDLPPSWIRRRSFDWGSSKPFSLGLWAITDGMQPKAKPGQVLPYFPPNSFIRFGEWYGAATNPDGTTKPNVGLRMSNVVMGEEIAMRTGQHTWSGDVADPAIFANQGSESIYEQLQRGARLKNRVLNWSPADHSRVSGWQRMRDHFEAAASEDLERPGLWTFDNCLEFIRTVPVLQAKKTQADDVDSDGEDHVGDETRYALMSRKAAASSATASVRGR